MVVGVVGDAATQKCQEMRQVVGILPEAAIGMQSGTFRSTNLGRRSLWSMHWAPLRGPHSVWKIHTFLPMFISFEIDRGLSPMCTFTKMDQVQPIDVKLSPNNNPVIWIQNPAAPLVWLLLSPYHNKCVYTVLGSLGFPFFFELGLVVVASFPLLSYTPKKKKYLQLQGE